MGKSEVDSLVDTIIGVCFKIHSAIGTGCFERVYDEILYHELLKLGMKVERQLFLPISYNDLFIKDAYRLDLLVNNMLIIEIKSIHPMPPVYFKQVKTQLSLLNLKHGLLLNFKEEKMIHGVRHVFNNSGREFLPEEELNSLKLGNKAV